MARESSERSAKAQRREVCGGCGRNVASGAPWACLLAIGAVAVAVACSGPPDVPVSSSAPRADVVSPPVGVADRGDDPAVVALDVGGALPCAGALVAADVVLTALHCVVLIDAPVACAAADAAADAADASKSPLSLRTPGSLRILVGDDMATAVDRAHAREIVVPPDARLCGADLALVLLDQRIDDIEPLVARSTGAARGDHVRTVGFGRAGGAKAKLLRDHVAVLDTAITELAIAGSALDEGGGPALDETTGAIVGVVSRNASLPFQAVYTRVDAFAPLVESALAMTESTPSSSTGTKKPKKGPADMGADCMAGSDCAAGVCVSAASGAQQYCSRGCGAHDRCPSLYACQRTQGGAQVCVRR
jgi:hypothetical protein